MTKNPDEPTPPAEAPLIPIAADPASVRDVPARDRPEEMRKAFEEVIARLPEAQRPGVRQELEVGWVGQPIASHDPEIARLWSRVLSLQAAGEGGGKPRE